MSVVLLPGHSGQFSFGAKTLVGYYLDHENAMLARAQRTLALYIGGAESANADKFGRLFRRFEVACALLAIEVFLWIADLTWGR